jgi:hypothetical protein
MLFLLLFSLRCYHGNVSFNWINYMCYYVFYMFVFILVPSNVPVEISREKMSNIYLCKIFVECIIV